MIHFLVNHEVRVYFFSCLHIVSEEWINFEGDDVLCLGVRHRFYSALPSFVGIFSEFQRAYRVIPRVLVFDHEVEGAVYASHHLQSDALV